MNMLDQFTEHFKTLSLREQAAIINELTDIRHEHFNTMYVIVEVYNAHANISNTIRRITGFQTNHIGTSGTQGVNRVMVPREVYDDALAKTLKEYFGGYSTNHSAAEWHDEIEHIINA